MNGSPAPKNDVLAPADGSLAPTNRWLGPVCRPLAPANLGLAPTATRLRRLARMRFEPELRSQGSTPAPGVARRALASRSGMPGLRKSSALFPTAEVFRAGAENCAQGGRAPRATAEFGLNPPHHEPPYRRRTRSPATGFRRLTSAATMRRLLSSLLEWRRAT